MKASQTGSLNAPLLPDIESDIEEPAKHTEGDTGFLGTFASFVLYEMQLIVLYLGLSRLCFQFSQCRPRSWCFGLSLRVSARWHWIWLDINSFVFCRYGIYHVPAWTGQGHGTLAVRSALRQLSGMFFP